MSVPPSMSLDPEVRRGRVAGDLAALIGEPPVGAPSAAPVLLVPGYTGSKEDFLPVLGPLARAGHRAVAIDLRGQHESSGPDDPAAYTLDAMAKDVTDVLSELAGGDPSTAHLVGHSFGGLVTRAAVIAGARPRTHVLVGSGPAALGGRRAQVIPLLLQVAEESGSRALADAVAEMEKTDPRMAGVPGEVTAFLHERWVRASVTGLRAMGDALLSAADEVDALAEARVRTLVVHGEGDDAWSPAEQRRMAERLGADYAVIPGSVHSPACEEPAGFLVALFGFWSG